LAKRLTTIYIAEELYTKAKDLAHQKNISFNQLIEDALVEYLRYKAVKGELPSTEKKPRTVIPKDYEPTGFVGYHPEFDEAITISSLPPLDEKKFLWRCKRCGYEFKWKETANRCPKCGSQTLEKVQEV